MGEIKKHMTELISKNFIKYHSLYHRILYVIVMLLAIVLNTLKLAENLWLVVALSATIVAFFVTETVLSKLENINSMKTFSILKYLELIAYGIIQAFIPTDNLLLSAVMILVILLSIEFIICGSEYDKSTVFTRKMLILFPAVLNLVISLRMESESIWFCYVLVIFVSILVVYFIVDWFVLMNSTYEGINYKLSHEKTSIESANTKLMEYQEKVKQINEKINYQKIDLARAIKELEQANTEIESQTEVMKYMASTFDVPKCIDVITDAIMDVKTPKLCALYIDKNVYMNKFGICIIKSNYTSMQRRLKKDIESIFADVIDNKKGSHIILDENLKKYRFIGDANINSLAILPLVDGGESYGIMIVGSDNAGFFDKGLKYYETCIVEFNVSIKSTKLYLAMQDMARKDGLTGIYNRIYFSELFEKVASESAKNKKPLSVALFDIDKFKSVNDTYGHLVGDLVIKMVASIGCKYAEKYKGFASRYGGEEFLVVFPGYDEKEALNILEAMHEEIRNTVVEHDGMEIRVDVCIGLSTYPNICQDSKLLVSRADKAMYYGKRNGRGRLVLDNPEIDNNL